MRTVFDYGFRDAFQGPRLGQLESLISIIPQLINTGVQVYTAKRAADRMKQDKERAEEVQKRAEAAQAAAEAARKKAEEQRALQQQGLNPDGTPANNKILGMDPILLAVGGLGLVGVGAALFMALRK